MSREMRNGYALIIVEQRRLRITARLLLLEGVIGETTDDEYE
jgi:hypothetical protein